MEPTGFSESFWDNVHWVWVKNRCPTWNPGKWKQVKNLWSPGGLILTHTRSNLCGMGRFQTVETIKSLVFRLLEDDQTHSILARDNSQYRLDVLSFSFFFSFLPGEIFISQSNFLQQPVESNGSNLVNCSGLPKRVESLKLEKQVRLMCFVARLKGVLCRSLDDIKHPQRTKQSQRTS